MTFRTLCYLSPEPKSTSITPSTIHSKYNRNHGNRSRDKLHVCFELEEKRSL